MSCEKASEYSDCVVGWTVSTVTVLCAGQSVQQMCCGVDSQYSDFIVGWTVNTVNELCAGQSVQ